MSTEKHPDPPPVEKPATEGTASTEPLEKAAGAEVNTDPARPLPAWGDKVAELEKRWVKLETALAVVVLIREILALCAWIFLKGLSTPPTATAAGIVFRAVVTATVFGAIAWRALRSKPERLRSTVTTIAVCVGLFVGRVWANVGVVYGSEIINWYQDASALTLIGGLRGVGTRLTIWLAMLGASLATSSGKHINIDVVMRFVPMKVRVPAAVTAWMAASVVCFTAAWGFVDHIAIASFGAPRDGTVGQKMGAVLHEQGEHLFAFRRQVMLDGVVGWRVFGGRKYTEALTGKEWNDRIRDGGYESWYKPEEIKALYVPPEMEAKYVAPLVIMPGKTQRGILVDDLNLLFPFGFLMLGFKFILRALLAISGHVVVDPDAMHRDDDAKHHHDIEEEGKEAA
jgi:hypothetical protein